MYIPLDHKYTIGTHLNIFILLSKMFNYGQPQWLSGLALPSVQGVILETRDQVPHRAPCMEPVSASVSVSVSVSLSLSVSLMNKFMRIKIIYYFT